VIPLGLSPMISSKLKVAKAKPNRLAIEFFISALFSKQAWEKY
jgi:hypothetical protein